MGSLFFNSLVQVSIGRALLILIYPDNLVEANWLLASQKNTETHRIHMFPYRFSATDGTNKEHTKISDKKIILTSVGE
jgi:hypothetical protein